MMKKCWIVALLFCSVCGIAYAEDVPSKKEVARLIATERALKNMATAVEMYRNDHAEKYPSSLDELVGEYLKSIPPGPTGKPGDFAYLVNPERTTFHIVCRGAHFTSFGLGQDAPQYHESTGLVFGPAEPVPPRPELALLPDSMVPDWKRMDHGRFAVRWDKGEERIESRVIGLAANESTDKYVKSMAEHYTRRQDKLQVNSMRTFTAGTKAAQEVETVDHRGRHLEVWVYDKDLIWYFAHTAPAGEPRGDKWLNELVARAAQL